jgi:hypothetical protein
MTQVYGLAACLIAFAISATPALAGRMEDPNAHIPSFLDSAKRNGATIEIRSCDLLVVQGPIVRNGIRSFGALCNLQNGERAKLCDDDMVGHFLAEPAGNPEPDAEELGNFAWDNCTGG